MRLQVSPLSRAQVLAGKSLAALLALFAVECVLLMMVPPGMTGLCYLSPVRWVILAFEGAIWRDFNATGMAVPCAVLLAVATVTFVVGVSRQQAD